MRITSIHFAAALVTSACGFIFQTADAQAGGYGHPHVGSGGRSFGHPVIGLGYGKPAYGGSHFGGMAGNWQHAGMGGYHTSYGRAFSYGHRFGYQGLGYGGAGYGIGGYADTGYGDAGTSTGYDSNPGYGTGTEADYATPRYAYAPPQSYVVPTTVYREVTRSYTVPVRSYQTVVQTHYTPVTTYHPVTIYRPVTSYEPVATAVQVPVTTYQTYQQTQQVPTTVYRQVQPSCDCTYR